MSPIDPGWSTSTILLLNPITPRAPISKRILSVVDYCLASLVGIFGIAIALLTLKRGIWWDEFVLLGFSTPGTSPREFLHEMITQDTNPISYYGMVYLLRAAGITNIMVLRSINLLGLPLAIFALSYGYRHKIINLSQAVIVWMLFASSPIFYDQFANLRCYFFLYAASLATSIIWYVLMLQLDSDKRLSTTTIAIWAADLMFFANLHYFATIFGGVLTAVLLIRLAIRLYWREVIVIAGIGLAAAAPAVVLGTLQLISIPKEQMSWISSGFIRSFELSGRMIEYAAARNFAVAVGIVVTCVHVIKDWTKWLEFRNAVVLLALVVLFLGVLIVANAVKPIIVDRYLIAGAGAITLSVAIVSARSETSVWLPTAVGIVALLLQAKFLYSIPSVEEGGWLPSARAVAQLKSDCPTTDVFAYPPYGPRERNEYDISVGLKINKASYGYYANKLGFSYEDLLPGASVVAEGPCPSVIWIEQMHFPGARADQILNELRVSARGPLEMRRYGSGTVIVVRE